MRHLHHGWLSPSTWSLSWRVIVMTILMNMMAYDNVMVVGQHIQPAEDRCVQEPCVYDLKACMLLLAAFLTRSPVHRPVVCYMTHTLTSVWQ
jgi:hypothetical protein